MNVRQFINKNLALIVMVPFIAGAHYGWVKLQEVDSLVTSEERKKNIITSVC